MCSLSRILFPSVSWFYLLSFLPSCLLFDPCFWAYHSHFLGFVCVLDILPPISQSANRVTLKILYLAFYIFNTRVPSQDPILGGHGGESFVYWSVNFTYLPM